MKYPFLQPRFEGSRYAEHTIPLEVAKDLAAYETLVIELAKHLYLKEHPERQRVVKGFASEFHLHLERVDEGSARPLLSIVAAGALALGTTTNVYFDHARDLIAECIAAPDGQLPDEFPRELLYHFNQIGRSLRPDESMALPRSAGGSALLTPDRRKHLVLAADQVYEREVELIGTVEEADWEKSTFRLRQSDGSKIVVPMAEGFHAQARSIGGRHRFQVTVHGVGAFDSWDRLQSVISVDSLEVQPDYQLALRFDELRALNDGWLDGRGIAPDKSKLELVGDKLIGNYPEKLPLPAIVPTPEGNLLFEWNSPGEPSIDLSLTDMKAEFHAFRPDNSDVEREFDLTTQEDWARLLAFLNQTIGGRVA